MRRHAKPPPPELLSPPLNPLVARQVYASAWASFCLSAKDFDQQAFAAVMNGVEYEATTLRVPPPMHLSEFTRWAFSALPGFRAWLEARQSP